MTIVRPIQPGSNRLNGWAAPGLKNIHCTSKFAQACIADTATVQIEKYTETLPPVTAFEPPKGA
jgi:hypothetical protein